MVKILIIGKNYYLIKKYYINILEVNILFFNILQHDQKKLDKTWATCRLKFILPIERKLPKKKLTFKRNESKPLLHLLL